MAISTTYSVPYPYSRDKVFVKAEIEDWREGWVKDGKFVGDGLPVLRVFKKGSTMFTLLRPYYLINAQKEYVVDPETQQKVIEYVTPFFDWKTMIREDENKLEPVHPKPLNQ